ncbi:hypothetical protein TSMEX_001728 [Taenia solium]|eukprot:TsM_001042000 transcript=TsM_001042000 gene=TsM_001042000
MKPMMQPHKEASSSSGKTNLGNQFDSVNSQYANSTVELEKLLYDQRLDLYLTNDFVRETSQGNTHQIPSQCIQPQENKYIAASEPNIPRRPVKLVNFKILNKYYQIETKSQVTKCLHDSLLTQWRREVQSSRRETVYQEASKASHDSTESQAIESRIQGKAKVTLNKTRPQSISTNEDKARKKSKREIMMEYSKTVAAANLPPSKHISTLDEELAKILHTYETGPQRIASNFMP